MASILRQIVASPRTRHPEANLDLCYVNHDPTIIATSGPSGSYPQLAYRNPLKDLVRFLDSKHGDRWCIWEFRAEGTGYPDEEVYGRVRHYPWPDHHPPPFGLVPLIVGSMRHWLKREDGTASEDAEERVIVVHCKAGKGRSGTVSCSYLIAEEGWAPEKAMQRFTDRRMRPGFGAGLSIPSQIRWVGYVDRWANKGGKRYVERPVEICEVHVWGLRDGVKVAVEGFVQEGKVIKTFHTFKSEERDIVRGGLMKDNNFADVAMELVAKNKTQKVKGGGKDMEAVENQAARLEDSDAEGQKPISRPLTLTGLDDGVGGDVVFRPAEKLVLQTSDVNIDFERRNKTSKYTGFTVVTSVAHVWFNTFFEGRGPENYESKENGGLPDDAGVFEIEWDAMDGIKGSSRKGTRAFDKLAVLWKTASTENGGEPDQRRQSVVIEAPEPGVEVEQKQAADWKGAKTEEGSQENISKPEHANTRTTPGETSDVALPDGLDGTEESRAGAIKEQGTGIEHVVEKTLGLRVSKPESRDISRASSLQGDAKASSSENGGSDDTEELAGVRSDVGPNGLHPVDEQSKAATDPTGQAQDAVRTGQKVV
ncbi:hypothetical protein K431DRAFT_283452 [Polychaeton citri CBS 116435]|uniref:phosphatidylinositol-3,4,5-trisphosphate 3-phosphatase n=1 Tax=Polychaeton citri CBS 116435 TaxID=1314669 RepID=A0A9P4QDH5_9PEZI|nr:hypothetical protein K431DRAFT_283452 [Polychaeton citri CBS 116435]